DAQLLGEDLSVGRLVTLPLRLGAEPRDGLARGMNPDLARVEHLQPEDVEVLRRPGADDLGEARDPDAHELTARALLLLLLAQPTVVDLLHRLQERALIIAAVVLPSQCGFVRKLFRLDEVLPPGLRRIL